MGQSVNPGQTLVSLRQAGVQTSAMLGSMTPRQRWTVAAGVLAVVVALAWVILRANQPNYTVLYSGLQPSDAQQVTAQLDALAIPYQLGANGAAISVPAHTLERARMALTAAGLPHSGQAGFSLFDKTNWSGSDFAEQVNYQRALQGELERTIETMHGVRGASVQITMAHSSLFTSEQRPAKAAVVVSLAGGVLHAGLVSAIRQLVAGAVDHLAPQNVSVMSADGQLAASGGVATQSKLESGLQAKILATLAPIVGAQHVRASVTVALDPTSSDDTQETYNPAASAVVSSRTSRVGVPAITQASGVPGTTSNMPGVQAPGTNFKAQLGLGTPQGQQTESQTFAVSRNVDRTVRPANTVQRITAAVVLDNATTVVTRGGKQVSVSAPRSPAEMQQMQALAAAAIGLDPARGDVLTVSNLPFYTPPPPALRPQPAPPASWTERLPVPVSWLAGALALVLLLSVLLALALRRRRPAAAEETQTAAEAQLGAGRAMEPAPAAAPAVPTHLEEVPHEVLNMTELLEADPDATPVEVQQVLHLKERVAERVRREPAVAGRLVQGWMSRREGH
ncbi:MAG: flagellar basal-body MS-ring/collar protein FliF [Terriglobales bacterium]